MTPAAWGHYTARPIPGHDARCGPPGEGLTCGLNVEPEPGLRTVAEPDGVELVGVFVDPGSLDAEFGRKGRSVHETRSGGLVSIVADQLGNAVCDGLNVGTVER